MLRKPLAVLLALVLLLGAAPLVFAQDINDLWLIYYEDADETAYTAVLVAPAKYTRVSDCPQIELLYPFSPENNCLVTPAAERITFSLGGETASHLALRFPFARPAVGFPGYGVKFAVSAGSVLDASGGGNERIFFEDDTEYREARGYTVIDVYSGLLRKDYPRETDTVAVGDTLNVEYSGLYPVEILINGAQAATFPGGEMQKFTCGVADAGSLRVEVRQANGVIAERTYTVISSEEMYQRNLRDGLITGEDIPSTADLIDVGVPPGSPFILLAKIVAFFVGVSDFFHRLFSFSRIAN